jgi:probable rRNA maturation factor
MDLTIMDHTNRVTKEEMEQTEKLLEFAGNYLKLPEDTMMSVTFTDNEEIQEINKEYRGKDMPTDVISFAIEEGEDEFDISFDDMDEIGEMPDFPRDIGDIFISIDRAKEQASEYGHSYARELGFLAVHGFLHINGYDHMTPEDEKEMFSLQEEILTSYGLERK